MMAAYLMIRDRLRSDAFLAAHSTGVFLKRAPKGQAVPLIVIQKQSGVSERVLAGPYLRNLVFAVKFVHSDETSFEIADQVDSQIDRLLTASGLLSDSHKCIALFREGDIEYSETVDNKTYWHVGGTYRPLIAPAR